MAWIYLAIAGVFEVIWATALKYSEEFTKILPTIITIVGMVIGFIFLAKATKIIPMGTAYAVWTGIGAVGAVIVGILLFKEPVSTMRILFLSCIVVGIIGLKVTSA